MPDLPEVEKSYWRESYKQALYAPLDQDLKVDTVIVGGGITGLTSAYLLKQAGQKVAVLDKDTIGGGTTGRTTGKVTSQHNLIYEDLRKRLGEDTARIYGEANQAAVEEVATIIKKEKIDCNFTRDDNYVYTVDPAQTEQFKKEARTAEKLGLPASFEKTTPLPFETKAAVKFTNQAKMNAQKYVIGLAKAVHGNGSYVFEHSHAIRIHDGNPCKVNARRATVTAKQIIVATNVPTLPLVARPGYCLLEYPTESYIVAGRPSKNLKGMYISPDSGQYSILPVDINGEQMLLVGGEGHISGWSGGSQRHYKKLAEYAQKHFGVNEILYKWSDRDYMAYDGIPLVGRLYPWSKHLYVASGYRKWGLSNSTAAAMILRDLITGKVNGWAPTFDPIRPGPVLSIPRVVAKHIFG